MLNSHCRSRLVHKTRHLIPHGTHVFEVDVFGGKLSGLIIAEVKLKDENETVALPPWLGEEISGDPRFGNFALAQLEALSEMASSSNNQEVALGEAGF